MKKVAVKLGFGVVFLCLATVLLILPQKIQGGECETCVTIQIDSCALNAGSPPACEQCRGLFQPCYDKYCHYEEKDCQGPAVGSCTKVWVGNAIGLHRSCVSGDMDWINCLGQPKCNDEGVTPWTDSDGRYSC